MKAIILFLFLMINSISFAQFGVIQSPIFDFANPENQEIILDTSVTNYLEEFNDAEDAIIYIYRLGGVLGAAAKWTIVVDKKKAAKLGMNDYTLVHVNTAVINHSVMYSNIQLNFANFKPNRYYMIRFKGVDVKSYYLDKPSFDEIMACTKANSLLK